MSDQPALSIIIPVYNGGTTLGACLDSIFSCETIEYEVIVVNDASTDNTLSVAGRYPCRIIDLPANRGDAHARNQGAMQSRAPYLLFTDADCIAASDWPRIALEELKRLQKTDRRIAAAEGRILPRKRFFDQCEAFATFGYNQVDRPSYTDHFCTANIIIAKAAFFRMGMFNANIPMLADRDLGIRLLFAGYRLYYAPSLVVVHNPPRHGLGDFLRHEYRWGALVGNYFDMRYPSYHRTPLHSLLNNAWVYAASAPVFAVLITLKIAAKNIAHNPLVLAYLPLVFASKIAYRLGGLQFIRSNRINILTRMARCK